MAYARHLSRQAGGLGAGPAGFVLGSGPTDLLPLLLLEEPVQHFAVPVRRGPRVVADPLVLGVLRLAARLLDRSDHIAGSLDRHQRVCVAVEGPDWQLG